MVRSDVLPRVSLWCIIGLLSLMASAHGSLPDLDGVAVAIRQAPATQPAGKRAEELVAYQIKAGKNAAAKVLFKADEPIAHACVSPFGNAVAFIKPGGTLSVVDIEGNSVKELVDDAMWVQWPAGDGGRWIYYLDSSAKNTLHRVDPKTNEKQFVVKFSSALTSFVLSQDATADWGTCLAWAGDSGIFVCTYPMARGDGDLFDVPQWFGFWSGDQNRGLSISPDGTRFACFGAAGSLLQVAIPTADEPHRGFRLDPAAYAGAQGWYNERGAIRAMPDEQWLRRVFKIGDWLKLDHVSFSQPVWSVNNPCWLAVRRENVDDAGKPASSSIMLLDMVDAAHHGIDSFVNVTENPAGVFERPVGFWEKMPAQMSLGYFRGEAPYRVRFEDPRLAGEWTWDFGDGSPRVKGNAVEHTYTRAGDYEVIAEKGDWAKPLAKHITEDTGGLFHAQVSIVKQQAPTAEVNYVDSKHLLVEFSEPVQAKDAEVSLGGKKIEKWEMRASGRQMEIKLAEPLKDEASLTLKGISDTAQTPNALREQKLKVAVPAWPTNRDGMVYVWENVNALNAVVDPAGQVRPMGVLRDGPQGGFDASGRAKLGEKEGAIRTALRNDGRAGYGDLAEVVMKSTFTFECTIEPANLTQRDLELPPYIVCYGAHRPHVWCFAIQQQADRLLVSVKTEDNWINDHNKPETGKYPRAQDGSRKGVGYGFYGHAPMMEFAKLTDTRPHHIIVTYKSGSLVTYVDGEKSFQTDRVTGELGWAWGMMLLGGHHWLGGSGNLWQGNMEGVAMYSRYMDDAEAKANYRAYARTMADREAKAKNGR